MEAENFERAIDLTLGGAVLYANDDFFAPKENLLKRSEPVFIPDKYTPNGKWMDGWESRRKRVPGHDFCIVRLGLPGILDGVVVDTRFFRGNFPEACSIDGACVEPGTPLETLLEDAPWVTVLAHSPLQGDSLNRFPLTQPYRLTHLRLNIFPDGGVARLRVHGRPLAEPALDPDAPFDLVAAEEGGKALACSDEFFGSRHNLLLPWPSKNMGEGWETRRRRGPGHDWCTLRLACAGEILEAEVDTSHFKGNYPDRCRIEARTAGGPWRELLAESKLQAHTRHRFRQLAPLGPVDEVRLSMFPDGGIARLRLRGRASPEGRRALGLARLNALLPDAAQDALLSCCGVPRFAAELALARPFAGLEELREAADGLMDGFTDDDWREAFRAHPKIGEKKAESAQGGRSSTWSAGEQAGMDAAEEATRAALARANEEYFERFGFIFIICASGLSAEAMLAALQARLGAEAEAELRTAADEQRKITHLRLEKLIA